MLFSFWGKDARKAQAVARYGAAVAKLSAGDLAIDCGANVGEFTLPMAQSGADVIAYEPGPEIFAHLKAALANWPKARLHAAAVSTYDGEIKIIRSPYFADDKLSETVKSTILPEARTRKRGGGWREMDHENTVTVQLINLITAQEAEGAHCAAQD